MAARPQTAVGRGRRRFLVFWRNCPISVVRISGPRRGTAVWIDRLTKILLAGAGVALLICVEILMSEEPARVITGFAIILVAGWFLGGTLGSPASWRAEVGRALGRGVAFVLLMGVFALVVARLPLAGEWRFRFALMSMSPLLAITHLMSRLIDYLGPQGLMEPASQQLSASQGWALMLVGVGFLVALLAGVALIARRVVPMPRLSTGQEAAS